MLPKISSQATGARINKKGQQNPARPRSSLTGGKFQRGPTREGVLCHDILLFYYIAYNCGVAPAAAAAAAGIAACLSLKLNRGRLSIVQ